MASKNATPSAVPLEHPPPHKQVLLLTCMDLRLLDNTVQLMARYNLQNRFDQVCFAGAALGVNHLSSPPAFGGSSPGAPWKDVFFHHLEVAINTLHRKISDIFIVEHRNCGAYHHYHPDLAKRKEYGENPTEQKQERKDHKEQAFELAAAIETYCQRQRDDAQRAMKAALALKKPLEMCEQYAEANDRFKAWEKISVRCFLMDLRGEVEHLT